MTEVEIRIALATLAALGTIGGLLVGYWLSALRDDRLRAHARQDDRERWERETEREDARLRREHAARLDPTRQELYAEFHRVGYALWRGDDAPLEAAQLADFRALGARIEILGGAFVQEPAKAMVTYMYRVAQEPTYLPDAEMGERTYPEYEREFVIAANTERSFLFDPRAQWE